MLRDVSARAKAQQRRLIYECHYKPTDSPNGTTVLDSVAAFLIGASEHSYFGLGAWENRRTWTGNPKYGGLNMSDHWIDGVMGRKLGAPLADAVYDAASRRWSRQFKHKDSGITTVHFTIDANCPKPCHQLIGHGTVDWASRVSLKMTGEIHAR